MAPFEKDKKKLEEEERDTNLSFSAPKVSVAGPLPTVVYKDNGITVSMHFPWEKRL